MGWMRGFPPAPDKQIRFTDPDYFAFPKLRWTACHFRELMPTVSVRRGTGAATALPRNLDPTLDAVSFKPGNGGDRMTWRQAFDANHSDGILVLHHGRIVYERHAGCLGDDTLHGAMSVTKSLTCLLGEMLVGRSPGDWRFQRGVSIYPVLGSPISIAPMDATAARRFNSSSTSCACMAG